LIRNIKYYNLEMRAAVFIGFFFLVSLSLIPGDAALPL
jgi:hypothetical protein